MQIKIVKSSELGPDLNLSPRYHMAPVLSNRDGSFKRVKNLGWLLRNWKSVTDLRLIRWENGEGSLVANLKHKKYDTFTTDFSDYGVMISWVHRPVFDGLLIKYEEGGK